MKLAEKILAILAVLGLFLKFSLIGGGNELFMISLLTLAGIYFALGFLLFNKIRLRDVTKKGSFEKLTTVAIVLAVMVGIPLSTVCVGILFKLLSFPGANEMLMIGVIGTIILSIAVVIMRRKLTASAILIRTGIIGIAGIVVFFTSSLSIVKLQYRNHPAYVEAYAAYTEEPKNEDLWRKKELEYHRIWMTEEEFKEYEQSQNN